MDTSDFEALILTLKLAFISTFILLAICIPLAWWLARRNNIFKSLVSAVVALPLVLPPTVLGFYLLITLGPNGFLGKLTYELGLGTLPFTFYGLVIGSVLYSLPFVISPLQNAFHILGDSSMEVAATLGVSPLRTFFTIILPQSKMAILTAGILGFAHTMGEFGIILMVGGNIPGETRVLSVAIYDHVESLQYSRAHELSLYMLVSSFILLFYMYYFNQKPRVGL